VWLQIKTAHVEDMQIFALRVFANGPSRHYVSYRQNLNSQVPVTFPVDDPLPPPTHAVVGAGVGAGIGVVGAGKLYIFVLTAVVLVACVCRVKSTMRRLKRLDTFFAMLAWHVDRRALILELENRCMQPLCIPT
jgi:hypothetical protein